MTKHTRSTIIATVFIFLGITLTLATIFGGNEPFSVRLVFSSIAVGVLKSAVALAGWFAIDKFYLKGIDTEGELKRGNTAFSIVVAAVILLFAVTMASAQSCDDPEHIRLAQTQLGLTEQGENRGPHIKAYLAVTGLPEGYPYCAAFVAWSLENTSASYPTLRSALSSDYITPFSIHTKHVIRGVYQPEQGAILVFRKGETRFGHVGFIERREKDYLVTIEANTSPGIYGSQRDGDGVYRRKRSYMMMHPGNYFRATYITPVLYPSR